VGDGAAIGVVLVTTATGDVTVVPAIKSFILYSIQHPPDIE
jgi:hypothetical protein